MPHDLWVFLLITAAIAAIVGSTRLRRVRDAVDRLAGEALRIESQAPPGAQPERRQVPLPRPHPPRPDGGAPGGVLVPLAGFTYRRRRVILGVWLVLTVVGGLTL